jgi:hypothetical protein
VAEVQAAKEAAERADEGTVVHQHLKRAGRWTLDIATKIGLPVAEAALKQVLVITS